MSVTVPETWYIFKHKLLHITILPKHLKKKPLQSIYTDDTTEFCVCVYIESFSSFLSIFFLHYPNKALFLQFRIFQNYVLILDL